jgi:peptidoglycan/xylan/chitin deacetylase (PgdA/CDA1 family)
MSESMDGPRLTFDDGPSESTGRILDLLAKHRIQAHFFVIGFRAQQRSDLVKRAADEGHTIGNHTWDHVRLTEHPDEDVLMTLHQTNDIIVEISGRRPRFFRGPWLAVDDRVCALAQTLGLRHMGANVDTRDYSPDRDVDDVVAKILGAATGDIVLLHDGVGDERGCEVNPARPKTVEALRRSLPALTARWNAGKDTPEQ